MSPATRRRRRESHDSRSAARLPARPAALGALGDDHRVLAVRGRPVRPRGREPAGCAARRGRSCGDRRLPPPRHADRIHHARREGHRGIPRSALGRLRERGLGAGPGAGRAGRVPRRAAGARAQPAPRLHRGEAQAPVPRRRARERRRRPAPRVRVRGRRAVRTRLGGKARPAAAGRGGSGAGGRRGVRRGGHHHHRHHHPHGGAAAQPRDRHHAPGGRHQRLHPPPVPAAGSDQGNARRAGRGRALIRRVHPHQPLAHPGGVLLERAGARHRRLRHSHRILWKCSIRRQTPAQGMKPTGCGMRDAGCVAIMLAVLTLPASPIPLPAQRPQPFDQQLRDNQQRLESIRRERSDVEQELERLRTQVHSLSDELANIERQKETTNRIVNELDRQIYALSDQIDRTTVDLLLAQNALAEKRAVLERRLVDISKRGPLYAYQVLLAAESFGDLLSRYKYLYLVSRQDRLLANDMSKLQRRIGRERQTLVDARDVLGRRKNERTEELDRYLALERERQTSLRETRRSAREALQRLSELERDEKSLNDRIVALERARREAEARGAATAAAITTADLGQLDWPVQGRIVYQFGTATGPNNTRIPWHGIGIAAPAGTPVRAIAGGTVSLAGPLGTYLTSVLVDHGGGYYSFYGYLSDATVAHGARVTRGQVLGHVGGGSSDQGPHLHFEIRGQGGIALDPVNWLKTRR